VCYINFAFISTYDGINYNGFGIDFQSLNINLPSNTQYYWVF